MLLLSQGMNDLLLMAAILLLPLFGRSVLSRCWQLAWGARWLFLSLFVILAWGGVGEAAWNGPMAPSREGLLDASMHVGRLLVVLMAVAVLREWMSTADLLTGIHRLLEPMRRCGAGFLIMPWFACCWSCATSKRCRVPATGACCSMRLHQQHDSEVFEIADLPFLLSWTTCDGRGRWSWLAP
jgi:hypothetical protein